jgi:signal transduction histidine kinase
LATDLRQAALLRSLAQITPAVAHDLRAPINAMVFNLEVLKETIAAGKGDEPGGRDRQLRYVGVLREELHRLHRGIETYIAQISPRSDRDETFDLREAVEELAALLVGPARKQQARTVAAVPETPVAFTGNRYLLRQALLHLAVVALADVPRDGALEIRLESRGELASIRIGPGGAPVTERPVPAPTEGDQLRAARSLLADLGGAVHAVREHGALPAYEVELSVTWKSSSREKE